MSRPRVAYVAHSVDPRRGGMELVSARLLERLAGAVDLEVVAGDGLETLPAGVRRTRVPIPRGPSVVRLVLFDVLASVRLRAVRRRSDLVHSCGAVAHARVDLMTLHLSHAAVIEAQGGARPPGRRGLRGAVAAWRRRRAARLERWALRRGRTRLLAGVSRAEVAALAARYPDVAVTLLEDGIDVERFVGLARHERAPGEALRAVVVAGDFERKGVPLAIRAIGRTERCRLQVLGAGDLAAMAALARSVGAEERVELLGPTRDVAGALASADVVLSCSLHESFGLAVAEGAAAGLAVVATATGVAPELVADDGSGPGGILVDPEAGAVAAALDALDGDPARCRAMGEAARRRAVRYTWDAMATATLARYDELLGRGP